MGHATNTIDELTTILKENARQNHESYLKALSPLGYKLYEKLSIPGTILKNHILPVESISNEDYRTRSACERARRNCLQPIYQIACNYFRTSSSSCIATEAAEYYSEQIDDAITPIQDSLKTYCTKNQQESIYKKIMELTQNSRQFFNTKLSQVLNSDPTSYSMNSFESYLEIAEIEKYDSRLEDESFIWRLLDALVSDDAITYRFAAGAIQATSRMDQDLNHRCGLFYTKASRIYSDYIERIVNLIDSLGLDSLKFEAK